MSTHSFSRLWVHLTWATLEHRNVFPAPARARVHEHILEYAREKCIYLQICFVNAEHVHALIDLPTNLSVEDAVKMFKGESSHWINQERVVDEPFHWQRGYGAFSVSHGNLETVCRYIAGQEKHHQKRTFAEELRDFVERCGLEWSIEEEKYASGSWGPVQNHERLTLIYVAYFLRNHCEFKFRELTFFA